MRRNLMLIPFLVLFTLPVKAVPFERDGPALDAPIDNDGQEDEATARYNRQTEKFNEIVAEVQTNDIFAGRVTELPFRGRTVVVDRSMEAVKYTPGITKGKASIIGALLNDLGVKGGGRIIVKVTQEVYNKDGTLSTRDIWEIDAGGMWEAQTGGFDDASGKQHK